MKHIEVVEGSFAIVENNKVTGVVTKINETQWGFYPLVPCKTKGISTCIFLHYALEEALKFEPEI